MKENDSVSIDPAILQDQSYQSRHHVFERILSEKEIGTVCYLDIPKSEEEKSNLYWVKFHMASIRIDEKYLIKEEL